MVNLSIAAKIREEMGGFSNNQCPDRCCERQASYPARIGRLHAEWQQLQKDVKYLRLSIKAKELS